MPPDFSEQRRRMVDQQIATPARGVDNRRVIEAVAATPRHEFLPENVRASAYDDCALPIGHGQTISQPYVVAFMTAALDPQPDDRVLEVGTGSGYQAAVLAPLVAHVFTIEIVPALAERARATLERLGYANVSTRCGDGYGGWPGEAPFDAIIATCAPQAVPGPLVAQLAEGGRMALPVGGSGHQDIHLIEKRDGGLRNRKVLPVRFVPMTGRAESA